VLEPSEPQNPKPLYVWKDPSVQKKYREIVTIEMLKWEFEKLIEFVDLRPWKRFINESWPEDSNIRRLAKFEGDFVRRCEWKYTSVIYLMLAMIEPPPGRNREE
jgi:hypothetical protein